MHDGVFWKIIHVYVESYILAHFLIHGFFLCSICATIIIGRTHLNLSFCIYFLKIQTFFFLLNVFYGCAIMFDFAPLSTVSPTS